MIPIIRAIPSIIQSNWKSAAVISTRNARSTRAELQRRFNINAPGKIPSSPMLRASIPAVVNLSHNMKQKPRSETVRSQRPLISLSTLKMEPSTRSESSRQLNCTVRVSSTLALHNTGYLSRIDMLSSMRCPRSSDKHGLRWLDAFKKFIQIFRLCSLCIGRTFGNFSSVFNKRKDLAV